MFSTETSKSISGDRRDTRHRSQTFLQHEAKFRGGKGKTVEVSGFPGAKTTKPKTRKETYEKSKHSVQSSSATLQNRETFPRLPCGSVYLGTQSHVSRRPGAVQRDSRGMR